MEEINGNNLIDRRTFVKMATTTGLTGLAYQGIGRCDGSPAVSENDSSNNGRSGNRGTVPEAMIDAGIRSLTGLSDVGAAWKSIMPNINADSVIAIKVNCRSAALPTHPEVTYAVVEGLLKMNFDGVPFPENNIHIYDNFKAFFEDSGYTINTSSSGVRCYSTSSYSRQRYSVNGVQQNLCTLVTDTADYLINIGVLKNHCSMAGVTLCMKNHFGTCERPRSMHIDHGDPYIPALNALEPIKNKQCINILDAIYGAAEGGPYGGPTFIANKILMSQDVVAVDYLGREMLKEQNSSTVSWATYIDSASDYGLGTNDPTQMEIISIANPSGTISTRTIPASSGTTACKVAVIEDEAVSM